MITITEFLESRIAEDETVARAAGGTEQRWDTMTEETGDRENIYFTVETVGMSGSTVADMQSTGLIGRNQAEHIARHDPARILAECAAKRAIIADYQREYLMKESANKTVVGHPALYYGYPPDTALRHLAAIYAAHPDYDPSWK